jgi:glycosyltransferase involved in cell wall biosynthesis
MYRLAVLNSHPIQYFVPLYRRLAQEPDIDLTVYFCHHWGAESYFDSGFSEEVRWDIPLLGGYQYKFLPNLRESNHSLSGFFGLVNPSVLQELYREPPDALWVHGHNFFTYLLAIMAAKVLGISVFMRCETHLLLKRSSIKCRLRQPIMTFFYRLFDACLPIGTRNAEFYRFHGVRDARLFSVPYTVDNHFFRQIVKQHRVNIELVKAELDVPSDKTLILFASKLTPRKRPMDLLRAYHRLREQGISAALMFVGSGIEEKILQHYVQVYQVPDVHFFGFRNQTELPKFYAAADVFVLPSENEPWGLVINEAMCAGLPVIAAEEIGAVADLVKHGQNGFTFRAGDIETLSLHLRAIATDSKLRAHMGETSYNMITDWDLERCVQGIRQALSQSKCTRRS